MDRTRTDRIDLPLAFRLSRRAASAALLATTVTSGLGRVAARAAPQATPAPADTIQVSGQVTNPTEVAVADLQALPAETVDATYRMSDGSEARHTFTGPRLWDALQIAEPMIEPELPESSLRLFVVLTAKDGYVVVLSMGEIDPEFGGQPYLLAWEEDGQPLAGEQGPAMLVTPGDVSEGRFIYGVVSIEVRSIDDAPAA
jgi:DMSO/TMAO reductase YedYZ molybdopterin-dependent catalytic subunit